MIRRTMSHVAAAVVGAALVATVGLADGRPAGQYHVALMMVASDGVITVKRRGRPIDFTKPATPADHETLERCRAVAEEIRSRRSPWIRAATCRVVREGM